VKEQKAKAQRQMKEQMERELSDLAEKKKKEKNDKMNEEKELLVKIQAESELVSSLSKSNKMITENLKCMYGKELQELSSIKKESTTKDKEKEGETGLQLDSYKKQKKIAL